MKNGWRAGGEGGREGGRRHERDREVEGGGALELAATCRSTSIMGTLQTTFAIWRWRASVQPANPLV